MKFSPLLLVSLLGASPISQASVGYFGSFYVVSTLNGGSNVFNTVVSPANNLSNAGNGFDLTPNGNPSLGSFGTIDLNASQSLGLNGFEMNTYNDGGDSVNSASLFYRVTRDGDTPGSFSSVGLSSPNSTSGNNKFWQLTNANINLTTGLASGNYTVNFYVQNNASFTGGGGGTFVMNDWSSSSGPSATFTVIPEPAAAILGALGTFLLLRRRK